MVLEAGEQLVFDPCQRIGREGGFAHNFSKQVQRRSAFIHIAQAAQRGYGHVAVGAITEVGAQAFKTLCDSANIFACYAFIEHGVGQQGQTGRVVVLAAAGCERQTQVEHRQLPRFNEQNFRAFGGFPGLYIQGAVAGRLAVQLCQRFELVLGFGLIEGLAGNRFTGVSEVIAEYPDQNGGAQAEQGVAGTFTLTHGLQFGVHELP